MQQRFSLLGGQPESPRQVDLQRKLMDLELQIKSAYQRDFEGKDLAVIERIQTNPKVFYSYAKLHSVMR